MPNVFCTDLTSTPTCRRSQLQDKDVIQCDGIYDCVDRSDENGCSCPQHLFECSCYKNGCSSLIGCFDKELQCDRVKHCTDGSDEMNCTCLDYGFACKNGSCIHRQKVNDGHYDCADKSDEFECDVTADYTHCGCVGKSQCVTAGRCIPEQWVGDSIFDCAEHGDDEPCSASKSWCGGCEITINKCVTKEGMMVLKKNAVKQNITCHSIIEPPESLTFWNTSWICVSSPCGDCLDFFQCQNGDFVDFYFYCDAMSQCKDNSDEKKAGYGFRCEGKSRKGICVLPQRNVYDSAAQCIDKSDLCFINGTFRCFRCLDGKLIISPKQVCDSVIDCFDASDECLCSDQSVRNEIFGDDKTRCVGQMHCLNGGDCVDTDKVLCNSSVSCKNQSNLRYCHGEQQLNRYVQCPKWSEKSGAYNLVLVEAKRCDGRPECFSMEDECINCPNPLPFCDSACAKAGYVIGNHVCDGYVNSISLFHISTRNCAEMAEQNCPKRFPCKSNDVISIDRRSLCDGIFDCDDHSDENTTECRQTRFPCKNGNAFSISKCFVCDGIIDCDNGEDEDKKHCQQKRFYCLSNTPISINKNLVENGFEDCSDGSDECFSEFSSPTEMIASPLLHALFWIMGCFAFAGNIHVGYHIVKDRIVNNRSRENDVVKTANQIFVFNIALSDFLMGFYLIWIASQALTYSGVYCFYDNEWKSSKMCSALGALVMLSSETSALTMAALSTFRLVTIYKPFLSSAINYKRVIGVCCLCWFLSFLLAVVPLVPFSSGYFINKAWMPNYFLNNDTISKGDVLFMAKHVYGKKLPPMSWLELKKIVSDAFKLNPIMGQFGFYSETSVCIPKVFASTSEAAWEYSVVLATINFLLFIYIATAYTFVYKKATGAQNIRSEAGKSSVKLQKKISRLLLTDFCCWIPICLMGYLSVAGVAVPKEAYVVSAGFLLPINSVVNPLIYSEFVDRHLYHGKKWILHQINKARACSKDKGHLIESNKGKGHIKNKTKF